MTNLKTAEQAVLNAVGQLGHGNVHQLTEASGYARSTVDKAIKVLSNAGLIVAYDTGAQPGEGTPAQWQLADDASAPIGADADDAPSDLESTVDDQPQPSDDAHTGERAQADDNGDDAQDESRDSGDDEGDDDENEDEDEGDDEDDSGDSDNEPGRGPANGRVLKIAGAMVAYPDGATAAQLTRDTSIPEPALGRLLTAMVSGGAAVLIDDRPRRWKNGTTHPAEIDPYPVTPRCGECQRTLPAGFTPAPVVTAVGDGSKAPDQRVLTLAGAMFGYTEGATAAQLATDSRQSPELVARLLHAMEVAGVASYVITNGDGDQPGEPLWMLKPGPLNTVDPEPKCPGCGRPKPGVRSSRKTPTGTRRADALPRNMLKEATLQFILDRPGIVLSPGKIAAALAIELNRDVVSTGAVKNNCEAYANEGKILLVSKNPWLFSTLPESQADTSSDDGGQQDTGV